MRLINFKTISMTILMTAGVVACGTKQADKNDDTQTVARPNTTTSANEAAIASEYAALPAVVVIRVPLNAQGQEVTEQGEMRTYSGTPTTAPTTPDALFAAAKVPTKVVSGELEVDTSTQSWQDWRPNQNRVGGVGGVGGSNRNYTNIDINDVRNSDIDVTVNNNSNYYGNGNNNLNYYGNGGFGGGGYYNQYIPRAYSVVNTSSYWAFQRPRCQLFGGFNYYTYRRPSCNSWSFCNSGSYGSFNNYYW